MPLLRKVKQIDKPGYTLAGKQKLANQDKPNEPIFTGTLGPVSRVSSELNKILTDDTKSEKEKHELLTKMIMENPLIKRLPRDISDAKPDSKPDVKPDVKPKAKPDTKPAEKT